MESIQQGQINPTPQIGPDIPHQSLSHQQDSIQQIHPKVPRINNPGERLNMLLEDAGATMIRHKKHTIYQLASGKKLVVSNTPSDSRAALNAISDLKRLIKEKE